MLVVGGIGSGKSTVAGMFGNLGAVVIEADAIGHQVLEPGGLASAAVKRRWPEAARSGAIDRRALAAIVFTDADQLLELEAITHPLIRAEIIGRAAAAAPGPVVVEMPLVRMALGSGWVRVFVDADLDTRLLRAVERGFDEHDARARAAAQPDRVEWLAQADHVLYNGGTLDELEADATALWQEIAGSRAT